MRRRLFPVLCACALVVGAFGASTAPAKLPVRATFVGDSVAASISYTPAARRQLHRGLSVRLDLRVCRRLVTASCRYQGTTPTSTLEAVQGYGRMLGDVLIVKVGYNESAVGYRAGIDRVMRAALAQGATGVVWVTLQETRSIYHDTNVAIKAASRRWPELTVADWNAYSQGKPWFGSDGLHLTATGAEALARFVRPFVFHASVGRP